MKRGITFVLLFLVVSVLLVGMVSAQRFGGLINYAKANAPPPPASGGESTPGVISGAADAVDGVVRALEPFIALLVGSTPDGELLFAKFLLMILIFSLVWVAVSRFPAVSDHSWVVFLVSLIVALLGVRFLVASETIQLIILPYSALAIAITAILPLIIYFFFVKDLPKTLRKIAWMFAAVVFVALYFLRFEQVGNLAYVYLAVAVGSVLLLLLDGTIQKAMRASRYEGLRSARGDEMGQVIAEKRKTLEEGYAAGTVDDAAYERRDRRLKKLEKRYVY